MSPAIALGLTCAGLILLAAVAVYLFLRAIARWMDERFPLSAEEVSRRQAEARAKQATKEFKKRQRLHTVKFWNF